VLLSVLVIGSIMMVATIAIEAFVLGSAIHFLRNHGSKLADFNPIPRTIIFLSTLSLWLLAGITAAVWLWAALFIAIGEFQSLEAALYFSIVTATTLGYGDLVLTDQWRLLSVMLAANGLFLFSLNTAFIFEAFRRLQAIDEQ
jgi:hypothetical protein